MPEKAIQVGDQELWLLSEKDWVLPIGAIPVKFQEADYYAVSDIVGFDLAMYEASQKILAPAIVRTDGFFSFIPTVGLPAVATKAPGINAKYYIRWDGRTQVRPKLEFEIDEKLEPPEPKASTREFIDHIAWHARAMSREDVMLLWQIITNELPQWLMERKKPVSFGYFTLWALPYRANWKQILLAKYPNIAATMNLSREKRDARLSLTDFERDLHHTDLVEFDKMTKSIGWTIEAVPNKYWDELVHSQEGKRYLKIGPLNYARFWDRMVWKLTRTIYDIFGAFVAKTSVPCAEPVKSSSAGNFSLGPCVPHGKVTPIGRDTRETRVVYPDHTLGVVFYGEPKSLREPGDLEKPIKLLPTKLSPLELKSEDVRISRGVLPPNGNEPEGTLGLLVPDDTRSQEPE